MNMKKKVKPKEKLLSSIWDKKAQVKIDLGCLGNRHPDFIGVDVRDGNDVDIVCNLSKFPWKELPDGIADLVMSSHLNEHIDSSPSNPQLAGLLDLLLEKKLITRKEVEKYVGEYRFTGGFIRFMNEVWRITKPGGKFMCSHPFAPSKFYVQDPTHINMINERTYAYFDPLCKEPNSGQLYHLYEIYRPMPWKVISVNYQLNGFMEVLLQRREIDPSYNVASMDGLNTL